MTLVPDRLARATTEREGEAGRRWLAELPGLVEAACRRWDCRIDGESRHGEVALVLPVSSPSGPAVLKISFPHPGNRGEPVALRAFDGQGAVRLLAAGDDGFSLLVERAGPDSLAVLASVKERVEVAGTLARQLAVPAPAVATTLASTCPGWLDQLAGQVHAFPDALPATAVERARSVITDLAADATPTMLHGDLHAGNILTSERAPWLAIDPKGWSGTAAFDAFTAVVADPGVLRRPPSPEVLRDLVRRFAAAAGVDAGLALDCVQARAVSSYLYELPSTGDRFALGLLRTLTELPRHQVAGSRRLLD